MGIPRVLAAAFVAAVVAAPAAAQQRAAPESVVATLRAAPVHACDTFAANPLDPGRVVPGVQTAQIDTRRAIAACIEAVDLFPAELRFQFQLGRAYRQAGQYDEAFRWYSAAANGGYAGAQNSLGVMYSRGEGVSQDCDEAAKWMGRAAAQGYAVAISNLRTLRCVRVV
ncbi:MAG: hypothetical protein O2905_01575 [Proteobacteria bacterium]|nr:hypothetical protein [Pseudomonadota bacterium]MDA1131901.1 hypothetical protein [Pseudomonadota bacterium]